MNVREEIYNVFEKIKKDEFIADLPAITKYIFIDLDNTSYDDLGNEIILDNSTQVNFYADSTHATMLNSNKMNNKLKNNKAVIREIVSNVGSNATDFKIICDVATALTDKNTEFIYIVSKDTDYDQALDYLRGQYSGKVKAIEKYSTLKECLADMKFMSCTTKEDVKREIIERLFSSYRSNYGNELLALIEA